MLRDKVNVNYIYEEMRIVLRILELVLDAIRNCRNNAVILLGMFRLIK